MNAMMTYDDMEIKLRNQADICGSLRLTLKKYDGLVESAIRTIGEMVSRGECVVPSVQIDRLQYAILNKGFKNDGDRIVEMTLTNLFSVGLFIKQILPALRQLEAINSLP